MNKKLIGVIAFAAGAVVGSVAAIQVVKTKYEQIANEEIASVKETYADLLVKMKKRLNESATYDGSQDSEEAAADEEDDEYYPDDDERDFTASEKEQIAYYKLTSKYRGSDDEDDSDENDEEGGEGGNGEVQFINGPYPITPEEFCSSPPGYNAQPLDYFKDGILADSWGMKVDIEETIGEDNLAYFGEYVDDVLYVRNERTEIDYEVTKDPRTYTDVLKTNPDPYYGAYET